MKETKRTLALVLALIMMFGTFSGSLGTAAYADEPETEEEPVRIEYPEFRQSAFIDWEFEAEAAKRAELGEDFVNEGLHLTLSAPEGVFPEGSELKVALRDYADVNLSVSKVREAGYNVREKYCFQVGVYGADGETYISPDTNGNKVPVTVTIGIDELPGSAGYSKVSLYRTSNIDGRSEVLFSDKELKGNAVTAEAYGLGYWTLEFEYLLTYRLNVNEEVLLKDICDYLHLKGTPSQVISTAPGLFTVTQNEDGEYVVKALSAFGGAELELWYDGVKYSVMLDAVPGVAPAEEEAEEAEETEETEEPEEGYLITFMASEGGKVAFAPETGAEAELKDGLEQRIKATSDLKDVIAVADEGYTFKGWMYKGEKFHEGATFTWANVPMLEDSGFVAAFVKTYYEAMTESGVTVSVTAPVGAFPEGTEMKVKDVEADEEILSAVEGAVADGAVVRKVQAVDISFWAGGVEVEPNGKIQVKITSDLIREASTPQIVHVPDAEDTDSEAKVMATDPVAENSDEMSFEADKFSVYVIVETTIEKNVLASDGHNYRITVTYGPEAKIPDEADLEVHEILQEAEADDGATEYETYIEKTQEALGLESGVFVYARIFDIKIVDADGEKVTIAAPVEVMIELADKEAGDEAAGETTVVHFADGAESGDIVNNAQITGDAVSFEAEGFSAYAIVQGPGAIPLGWTKVTSLAALKEKASEGLYIGTTGGFYMTNTTAAGSSDPGTTGIVKTKPAQSYPADAAVRYYFEFIDGTDQAYIYCFDGDGNKQYVRNTGDANLYLVNETDKTAFTVLVDNNGRFRFQNGSRYWNMWNGANGNHIACWTSATDANNYFYLWEFSENESDPYGLDGRTYGLMYWVDGTNGKALMSTANGMENHLDALSLTVMSKANNSSKLYVPDNSEISFWTFHHVEDDIYYLTAVVDGSTKYLKITSSGLTMVSTPDEGCRIQVVPGEGSHTGQISLKHGNATLAYSGNIEQGFKTGGTAGLEWLNLVEESELDNTYFMTYSAQKVSVSDEAITNGSHVIVYTRVWNDTTKKYEFYAVDHDGSLVRCYESGDSIEWVGGRLNSMLWDFVEYYWEGSTDPNGYYELYNQYSEKYIAPQKSSEQVLSDSVIGINMSGRQNGRYHSPIVAWDDGYYAYAGLKAEGGHIVSCPLSEASDFYFAIVEDLPVDDELHTVPTVDHTQYGITMKMVNFPLTGSGNNDSVRKTMSDFLGSDNGYKNGNTESGLLGTSVGVDGYPVTKKGNSFSEWFAGAQEVNHLFIASTYSGTGYYEFDSTQNFAHLDQGSNNFVVYKELAASASSGQFHDHGHFWPYNDIEVGRFATNKNLRDALGRVLPDSDPRKYEKLYTVQKSNTNFAPDYYMGMEVTATFTQTPNGEDDWGHDIIYEFTGDDDFWLFVDGELIIDLGGIHDALAGSVNYKTGDVYVNGTHYTLRGLFESNYRKRYPSASDAVVAEWLSQYFDEGSQIFKDYSTHTMKIYYLERGAGASNLHMRFNLASIKPGTVQLTKHLSGVETSETVLAEFPYQILYKVKGDDREYYLTNSVPQDPSRVNDYVFYKDSTVPVTYKTEYTIGGKAYNDVFILKPDETADINFPLEKFTEGTELDSYRIVECGVNTDVYSSVKINGADVEGTGVEGDANRKDYATEYASTEQRSRVVYDNAVKPDALTNLNITKKLYDVTGKTEITEETDKTVFDFRLYLATETGEIDSSPANMHTYHVKDPDGNYCVWSVEKQRIVSLGGEKNDYSALTPEEQEAATFHTSMNGSITKIPVGYMVEVRDLLKGTKFKLVERPSEIPDGYSFLRYTYNDERSDAGALTGVTDTITDSDPHVEVHNIKGFGLRVNKTWTDADFMSERDPVYFGIFYLSSDGSGGTSGGDTPTLVEGSLRQLPYGSSSIYWYYERLPVTEVTDFAKYVIYEVTVENPVVDAEGKVTSYSSCQLIDGEKIKDVTLSGKQVGDTAAASFSYTVSYKRGELSTNDNVRVDEVTNSRPGIILKKTEWDGTTPLAGARFLLADEQGNQIGTYTSGEDGLITEAFLRENVVYTLTETAAPQGWHGLEAPMGICLNGETVTVTGVEGSYYNITPGTDSEKTTLTVKNRPYLFRAVKLDAGSNAPLADVSFKLYRQITVDNVQSWDPNPYPGYENLKSGTDGVIFSTGTLPAGTYQLRETAALPGYQTLSGHVTFTVSATGAVSMTGINPAEAALASEAQQDGSMLYTLTIRNSKLLKVSVWKTDEGYTALTGAAFSLYRADDYDDNAGKPKEGAHAFVSGTVGTNGILQLGKLPVGEYRLLETKAPDGYTAVGSAICITVRNDVVTAQQGVTQYMVCKKGDEHWVKGQDDDTWQIRVPNNSGISLPATGGMGTRSFRILGTVLIALAGMLLALKRRRRI